MFVIIGINIKKKTNKKLNKVLILKEYLIFCLRRYIDKQVGGGGPGVI